MQSVFQYKYSFNQDIGAWDTSAVTNMQQMFYDARAFNQDIGSWDVSSLLVARYLFSHARAFNQDISMWDVSAATDFHEIFTGAISFVQDISGWVMKDASVIVTLMFNNPCSASVPCNAWHTTFTNCGHPASAIPSICTSGPYAPSSAQYSGPPGAWQINVPVVIIPPPIIAATGTATATASPASTVTATATASGGWKYSSALAAGDRITFSPSSPSGLQNHVGVLETRTGDFITRATTGVSSSTVWKFCGVVPEGNKVFFTPHNRSDVGVVDTVTNVVTTFVAETNAASSSSKHCAPVMVGTQIFGYACSSLHQCAHVESINQNALGQ
jgi:surface protein